MLQKDTSNDTFGLLKTQCQDYFCIAILDLKLFKNICYESLLN